MSAIDYLHTTPEDRYAAAAVARDHAGESRLRRGLREARGLLAIFAVGIGLIALRIWVYMPASFHLHG
jgi:hypothetical protein